ncbi:hypothetical protein BRADI_2g39985v3 [Brachypodium distachyon]|uniref:Solute carrier family 40 protein n=1 Tax=Brachypodium distachyon TaxID=15368 RepID=A0A2K2DCX4_BRADI|nr:hypothetical protein BRADI_2g39985v3 [Brachypodium distachyon]
MSIWLAILQGGAVSFVLMRDIIEGVNDRNTLGWSVAEASQLCTPPFLTSLLILSHQSPPWLPSFLPHLVFLSTIFCYEYYIHTAVSYCQSLYI